MKQRGRKSATKMSIVASITAQGPAAPDDLLPHERDMWDAIVLTKSVEWFDASVQPLLSEYCRQKSSVDLIADQIENFASDWFQRDGGLKRFKLLTEIRDKLQGRLIGLATVLRLTN